jgi:GDP-L-fucose synthase
MDSGTRIFVAGHRGLVGGAIVRRLRARGYERILTRTHHELDLTRQAAVEEFFAQERPDAVILAAAKVGGIVANNTYPADFIGQNLLIQSITIDVAYRAGVKKFIFLGSSCIYPKHAPQPIREEHLLTGSLEPTNEAYAVAKIAGLKMCEYYRKQYGWDAVSLMPTNLYGPGDNFDLETSHVLPALIRKFHEAKLAGAREVPVWGTGTPRREFLHVDDMASATVFVLEKGSAEIEAVAPERLLNVGYGDDIAIGDVARLVREIVGTPGEIVFDTTKPDGTPRKMMDSSRLRSLGWRPEISLRDGLRSTYAWYLENGDKR